MSLLQDSYTTAVPRIFAAQAYKHPKVSWRLPQMFGYFNKCTQPVQRNLPNNQDSGSGPFFLKFNERPFPKFNEVAMSLEGPTQGSDS